LTFTRLDDVIEMGRPVTFASLIIVRKGLF